MARFLFIWMVMLGAMIGVRDGTHFDVDVWPELKPRTNALLRIVSTVFVLVFALVFCLVRHQVRAVRLGPDLRARRHADDLHLRRVAADGVTWLLFGGERILARSSGSFAYGTAARGDEPPTRDIGKASCRMSCALNGTEARFA